MYEKTTARVVVGEGVSEEFEVNIGLRQGSVQSLLLFIAVVDSRKTVMKDAMKNSSRPGDEWQTVATGDIGGVEQALYQTRAGN